MKAPWWGLAAVVVLDQSLKWAALALGFSYEIGNTWHPTLALAVTFLATVAFLRYRSWGLLLVASGGISNLIDLWRHNYVLDIFLVKNFAFNLADLLIFLGFSLILLEYLRRYNKSSIEENKSENLGKT